MFFFGWIITVFLDKIPQIILIVLSLLFDVSAKDEKIEAVHFPFPHPE